MSKPTPGPWLIVEKPDAITVSSWHIQIGSDALPFFPYRRAFSGDGTKSGLVRDDEKHANARLIASAPELLEALQGMVKQFGYDVVHPNGLVHDEHEAIRSAISAIAKATGGAA